MLRSGGKDWTHQRDVRPFCGSRFVSVMHRDANERIWHMNTSIGCENAARGQVQMHTQQERNVEMSIDEERVAVASTDFCDDSGFLIELSQGNVRMAVLNCYFGAHFANRV
jgi:hypothetical protein